MSRSPTSRPILQNAVGASSSGSVITRSAAGSASTYFRHKRAEQYAVITKRSTTSRDSFITLPQGPPIGTYNLPTTFDENARDPRASASFRSNGRSANLLESNAMHYKSTREECSKMNIGPGSYNVGYTWRPESPYEPSTSAESSLLETSPKSKNRSNYERQWLVVKSNVPVLTPREKQRCKIDAFADVESVKSLPSY